MPPCLLFTFKAGFTILLGMKATPFCSHHLSRSSNHIVLTKNLHHPSPRFAYSPLQGLSACIRDSLTQICNRLRLLKMCKYITEYYTCGCFARKRHITTWPENQSKSALKCEMVVIEAETKKEQCWTCFLTARLEYWVK